MAPLQLDLSKALPRGAAPGVSLESSAASSEASFNKLLTGAGFDSLFMTEPKNPLTADQFEQRFKKTAVIGSTTLTLKACGIMDLPTAETYSAPPFNVYQVELKGPPSQSAQRSLFNFQSHPSTELRKVVLKLHVGSEKCPDWDHANLCLTAIKHIIQLADGCMPDEVIKALREHMNVISA